MKNKFTRFIMACFFVSTSVFTYGQNFKTELRFLDPTEEKLNAGLNFTGINKVQFEQLVEKSKGLKLYSINSEYFEDKKVGFISYVSNTPATIRDFQGALKQLEISSLYYYGKLISIQEIESNYKPLNKSEIINTKRN